tara:strand:+ start:208 stop:429 length:222 start_codon:yes stop_codon:yes gene_type:complete
MDKNKLMTRLMPLVTDIKWDSLEDYLSYERHVLVEQLIQCTDIKQINKLQGELKLLDKILDLPNYVKKVATSY